VTDRRRPGLHRSAIVTWLGACAASTTPLVAQVVPGRQAVEAIEYPPLEFEQPDVAHHEIEGVPILHLESHELPLVSLYAYFRGGYGLFDRSLYGVTMGLPALLRYGGTLDLPPDSVDELLEYHAISTTFGSAGGAVTSTVNALSDQLAPAVELWGDLLARPRFDSAEIEVWRGQQLESVLRRTDDPGRLAFSEFNRLLFGDHPIGWEMEAQDVSTTRVTEAGFREAHARIVCRDNLVLGVSGDIVWADAERLTEDIVRRIRPCSEELPEPPKPDIRRGGGVFVIERDLDQAVIVLAHPTDVRLGDSPEYYSATIGNSVLGSGGFSSRIMARVRTEEGFAYGASSVWTMPREHEGILGAVTRTRPENAVPAIRAILGVMDGMTREAPTVDEIDTAVDQIVNGFVFNFETAGQIVARSMSYLAQDLPDDWLERYLVGVQGVTPASVRDVFAAQLRPDEMTILVVGDPERIGTEALEGLGPVTILEVR